MDYSTNILSINIWSGLDSLDKFTQQVKKSNCQKVILMSQFEFCFWNFPSFNHLLEIAKEKNISIDVVTGTSKYFINVPNISDYNLYHYPITFFSRFLKQVHDYNCITLQLPSIDHLYVKDVCDIKYKYHFLSMNRLAHEHRCEMLDMLSLHDLIHNNAISWYDIDPYPYQYKFWTPQVLKLTDNFELDWNTYTVPKEFYNSFAQLVIESTTKAIFVTEKTVTPLFLGKPFLVASCQGFHAYLKTLGFELYDELFDYSFDNEPNQTMRFSMIADNFRKLSRVPLDDLPELARIIKEKVEHNKLLSYKLATDYTYYPTPMEELVNVYENTGTVLEPLTIGDYTKIKSLRKIP
jgi:hypothetical protein